MLRAVLNGSWRWHPAKQQLYGHLPPVTKIIQVNEPDLQDTDEEAIYFCEPLHMDE